MTPPDDVRPVPPAPAPLRGLVGVGVGPGDPDLVTIKAARVLASAHAVAVPVGDRESAADAGIAHDPSAPGRAEATVRALAPHARVVRLPFALHDRASHTARREAAWDAAARDVLDLIDGAAHGSGPAHVAFATIGDPHVYSTFTALAAHVTRLRPGTPITTVPGITAMQALAAANASPLVTGTRPLTLVPAATGFDAVEDALRGPGAVIVYKAGARLDALRDVIDAHGRLPGAVVGEFLGLPGERVRPLADADAAACYLSAVLVPARDDDGGRR